MPDCLASFGQLPFQLSRPSRGLLPDNRPTVCGGRNLDTSSSSSVCLALDPASRDWVQLQAALPSGGLDWSGSSYSQSWGLVVTGGRKTDNSLVDLALRTTDGNAFVNQALVGVVL